MKHLTNYYVAFVFGFAMFGCDGKRIDRVQNEKAAQTNIAQDNEIFEGDQKIKASADNKVWSESIKDLKNLTSEKNVDTNKLQSQLLAVEKILLHEKTLSDRNYYQSLSFRDLVAEYNKGILLMQQKDAAALEKSGLLKRYVAILMDGCQIDQSECKHLLKFKVADNMTAQVLVTQASILDKAKDKNLQELYQLLKAALDLQTVKNVDLESLYFKNAIQYLTYLKQIQDPKAKNKDPKAKSNEIRLKSDLTLLLEKLSGQFSSGELQAQEKKNYCDFLQVIEPLSTAEKLQVVEDKRKKGLIQDYLTCQAGKSSLEESFKNSLATEREQQHAAYEKETKRNDFDKEKSVHNFGYNSVLKFLEADTKIVKAFDLKLNHTQDASLFIIDKLYYDAIDLNQAQQLMQSIKIQSDLDVIKNIRYYTQNQTTHLINETLRIFKIIFKNNFDSMGLKGNLFAEVIKQVNSELFQPWYSHLRHIAEIEKLIQMQFDRKYRTGFSFIKKDENDIFTKTQNDIFTKTQKEMLNLRSELANIKNHLNMVLSTPMDYALYYYMSQVQGSVRFDYNLGVTSIPIDAKAEEILSQNIMPSIGGSKYRFFNIIPVEGEKNKDDFTVVSLQYALKIGLFDKFPFDLTQKGSNKSGLELFSSQFLKETIVAKRAALERNLKDLVDLRADREFENQAAQICRNPLTAPFSLSKLESLRIGLANEDSLFKSKIAKLYGGNSVFFSIDRPNDVIFGVNQMKTIFNDYLTKTGSTERTKIIQLFDDQISYIQNGQKQMAKLMLELDHYFVNEKANCLKILARGEYYRYVRLFEESMQHYKNVYAAMTMLRIAKEKNLYDLNQISEAVQSLENKDVVARINETINTLKKNNLYQIEGSDFNSNYLRLVESANKVYAIHNSPTLANKYGYYINENMLNFKDGKQIDLKRVSFFNENSYIEALWDATLRVKSYLTDVKVGSKDLSVLLEKPVPTDYFIGLGIKFPQTTTNDAESMTIWDSSKKNELSYDTDPNKFYVSAAKAFANQNSSGVVSWFSTTNLLDILDKRLELLIAMARAKPMIFGDIKDKKCEIDRMDRVKKGVSMLDYNSEEAKSCGVIKIKARDLLNAFLDMREFYNNTPEEIQMYQMLGLDGKFPDSAVKAFRYSTEESTREWTYFDEFIRKQFINNGGENPYITGIFNFGEFKKRKDISLTSKDNLLGIDRLPVTLMRETVRKVIFPQIEWVLRLEKEVRKMEDEHGKQNFKLENITFSKSIPRNNEDLDNSWRVMRVNVRTNGPRTGTPIYLRDPSLGQASSIQWFRDFLETNVVENTNCDFLPQEGDADYIELKAEKCEDRYKEWFKAFTSEL